MAFAIIEDAEEPRMTSQIDEVVRDAYELAKSLRKDTTLSAMQRLAVDRIITGFEAARDGLAYTPRASLILKFEARTREYESAIEQHFKPSLRQAIADVVAEFIDSPAAAPSMKAESE